MDSQQIFSSNVTENAKKKALKKQQREQQNAAREHMIAIRQQVMAKHMNAWIPTQPPFSLQHPVPPFPPQYQLPSFPYANMRPPGYNMRPPPGFPQMMPPPITPHQLQPQPQPQPQPQMKDWGEESSMEEALSSLLQTSEGREALLHDGETFGLTVEPTHKADFAGGILQFGLVAASEIPLESSVPYGYEDNADEIYGVLKVPIVIKFTPPVQYTGTVQALRIKSITRLPRENKGPTVVLEDSNDECLLGLVERGNNPMEKNAVLKLKIPKNYVGHLSGWIILGFEIKCRVAATCWTTSDCTVGLRCTGCVSAESSSISKLTSDAKVFVPMHLRKVFDAPMTTNTFNSQANDHLRSPDGFRKVCQEANSSFFPPQSLLQLYVSAVTASASEGQMLLRRILPHNFCAKGLRFEETSDRETYIQYLRTLQWCEEIQMNNDIKNYDMHDAELNIKLARYDPYKAAVKIKVKGSNEQRPSIRIGDPVRFRPASSSDNVYFQREIVGIVSNYVLAAEEVTIQIPLNNAVVNGEWNDVEREISGARIAERASKLNKQKFHIRFSFDRCGLSFAQRALEICLQDVSFQSQLFPMNMRIKHEVGEAPNRNESPIDPGLNHEQYEACRKILYLYHIASMQKCKLPPYVIFGPPGTGKTKTLVASILEIHRSYPTARILVTAPSDAATDVIAKRLVRHYSTDEMFRLNWWQRVPASLAPELSPYSHNSDTGVFDLPLFGRLDNFKVVISTCGASGCIRNVTQPFDVVIVDEASQVFEPEVLIPLTMANTEGVTIIAGDTEQLSNSLRTPLFKIYDSYHSLQDRLLQSPFYGDIKEQHETAYNHFVFGSFLRKNYRSHPDIFEVSSKLFYNNALLAAGDERVTNCLLRWTPPRIYQRTPESLPLCVEGKEEEEEEVVGIGKRNTSINSNDSIDSGSNDESNNAPLHPNGTNTDNNTGSAIHFVGVNGIHAHELDSPSFYNELEISTVVELCKNLISSSSVPVEQTDIGVIAAFRSQVLKIRLALREVGLGIINVGSVYDFQGQEVKIVIISTVLTSGARIIRDECTNSEKVGLFGDHRKFNVAVTRAMALCIVVGDPYMLCTDSSWKEYIESCDRKGRYAGIDCKLLQRHVKQEDEVDAEDLLNAAVQFSLRQDLGSGLASQTIEEQYYSDDLVWRTFL